MTDPVAEARRLLAAATPGPWERHEIGVMQAIYVAGPNGQWKALHQFPYQPGEWSISYPNAIADAELIAAAPSLLADLVAEVERLRAAIARLLALPSWSYGMTTGEVEALNAEHAAAWDQLAALTQTGGDDE